MEPLQDVPFINLALHWLVFSVSLLAFIASAYYYARIKRHRPQTNVAHPAEQYSLYIMLGLLFYTISEYSDLYTPGLLASLGMHNYFTELSLLIGMVFIIIAVRRMIRDTARYE